VSEENARTAAQVAWTGKIASDGRRDEAGLVGTRAWWW